MHHWQIGAVKITRIVESINTFDPALMLPGVTARSVAQMDWLQPHFADASGRIRLAIQALVVETPTTLIVIDTCVGNERTGRGLPHWNNLQTRFLEDFAAAGFDREVVDVVFCTHLHSDHVGWNTMKVGDAWLPTFPNARYLLNRAEYEPWLATSDDPGRDAVLADSIAPIQKAGLLDLIGLDHVICPEIALVSTPGHTPGHASVRITCGGQAAMISGDFIHHPCQMATPELPQNADSDPRLAATTRRGTLDALAGQDILLIGTHFAPPTAGHVRRAAGAFRFEAAAPEAVGEDEGLG
jgi:glyoxylase-like metal-dependent hydrolase (beta-lactamase superfamily II)